MKTFISAMLALLIVQAAFANRSLPENWVIEKFKYNFPDSKEIFWSETQNEYVVRFMREGVLCRLYINKEDAKFLALIRHYPESRLNPDVREQLHSFLPGASIHGVTEVNISGKRGYEVIMETGKHYFVVDVDCEKNCTIKNKFKKC
ncbi:MAG TPA: hypothetical protein PLM81_01245 [Ginsengibacter sp.]|nr:hypothetical protein [Ginsengibacter sp.]HRP43632.1 hypothetical protein [Ginsengibacter sp.]